MNVYELYLLLPIIAFVTLVATTMGLHATRKNKEKHQLMFAFCVNILLSFAGFVYSCSLGGYAIIEGFIFVFGLSCIQLIINFVVFLNRRKKLNISL